MKKFSLIIISLLIVLTLAQCAPTADKAGSDELPLFYGAFATPIEEPWDGVIHEALQKAADDGKIRYEYSDDIGYAGDMERVLREVAEQQKPAAIFGDAFGNEEAVRRVAKDYPEIAFVFGSGYGPAEPNVAVFDNWIHEPAYLCGLIAGGMTETGVIGVVGGMPVPEVNRIVNAFIEGVKEVNPDAQVLVTFINSWFDPAAAKEAALAQVDAGADILFAERFGVIEAAVENGLYSFGSMSDQNELGPESVISGPVWNMNPTVDYIIGQVAAGSFTAQDLKDFSMMAKGGATLADFHGMDDSIPADILALVQQRQQEILDGLFRVNIDEATPDAVN
ncbi:MAG: BMP family protein [Anaerolineales bacterium]|nr:BMP family protein [Anaerolineales bacterium]